MILFSNWLGLSQHFIDELFNSYLEIFEDATQSSFKRILGVSYMLFKFGGFNLQVQHPQG